MKEFDLIAHLNRQRGFSRKAFDPGPHDLEEWAGIILLALDGAWRAGYEPHEIAEALADKQAKNESRKWPDWRTADPDKAIEHIGPKVMATRVEHIGDATLYPPDMFIEPPANPVQESMTV